MRVITFIERYGIVIYIAAIVLSIVFSMFGFVIINTIIINVLKILYFIILICAIISCYKLKRKNAMSIVLFFLPIILMFTDIPFKVVTMVLVVPVFFFNEIKPAISGIGILIYILSISIGAYGIMLGDFGIATVIDQQYSPNRAYRVVAIDSDQGALGGDTYVDLEQIYYGIIKRNIITLYHGHFGEKPKLKWIDNNTVNIDGRDIDIHINSTWENKH